jgi:hypothetical protein
VSAARVPADETAKSAKTEIWLGDLDSNQDWRSQRPLFSPAACYLSVTLQTWPVKILLGSKPILGHREAADHRIGYQRISVFRLRAAGDGGLKG